MKEKGDSIARLRGLGEIMEFGDEDLKMWQQRLRPLPAAPELVPRSDCTSPTSGGAAPGAAPGAAASSGAQQATRTEKEAQAQALICTHYEVGKWLQPNHFKRPVHQGLKDLIPKKTLRRFLMARPQFFEIQNLDGKQWQFRRIA